MTAFFWRFLGIITVLAMTCLVSHAQTLQQVLDATNLTWTTSGTGGSPGWAGQTNNSYDGVSSAVSVLASGDLNTQTATLQTTVTGPGTLTFWWRGSAPDTDGTKLAFLIGTNTQVSVVDGTHWTQQTIYVGQGSQTLKWVFTLPGMIPPNFPGFVDQVTWTTGPTQPLFVIPPWSQSVVPGLNATFFVGAAGTPPLNYIWQANGTNLPGATNATLIVSNVQPQNLGTYRVIVLNSVRPNISPNASLEFGEMALWGSSSNIDNRGVAPPGSVGVRQISGGNMQNILLKSDGSLINWGATNQALAALIGVSSNILHASADFNSGVVLNANGTVTAWGDSALANIPPGLTNVIAISQGPAATFCLALKSDGHVVGWGHSSGTNVPSTVSNVVSIAAGYQHAAALMADGTIALWGDNSFSQLKFPANIYSSYPTNKIVAIAAGGNHTLALKADGSIVAWGNNSFGQTNVPGSTTGAVAISAGFYHNLALRADGTVVAWGRNLTGEASVPTNLHNVVAISAGAFHSMALVGTGAQPAAAPINPYFSSNLFRLSIPSQNGRVFELDYATSLNAPNWNAFPYVPGNGSNITLLDNTATNSQRFYRVRRW